MLARAFKSNVTAVALRQLNAANIRLIESRRNGSHGATELQHGHGHDDHHHDHHQVVYERLWRNKATLDWLPKPEGSWQEYNGKKQAHYNQVLAGGLVLFVVSVLYFRAVVIGQSRAFYTAPYHLIGHEDFPGSKYEDAAGTK